MSALPPIADMLRVVIDVRKVPKADIKPWRNAPQPLLRGFDARTMSVSGKSWRRASFWLDRSTQL